MPQNTIKQQIQLLYSNNYEGAPKPEDLKAGQPFINVRDGIQTLYFKDEHGTGLIEFIPKTQIISLIKQYFEEFGDSVAKSKVEKVLGSYGINSQESVDENGNKVVTLSIIVDSMQENSLELLENGLYVNPVIKCGEF